MFLNVHLLIIFSQNAPFTDINLIHLPSLQIWSVVWRTSIDQYFVSGCGCLADWTVGLAGGPGSNVQQTLLLIGTSTAAGPDSPKTNEASHGSQS